MEAESVFDDGEGVLGCERGHDAIGEDEDGDCCAGVDFIG